MRGIRSPTGDHDRNPVDLNEFWIDVRPFPTNSIRWHAKTGAFHMPVSLENRGVGWSDVYSITPSALNTWMSVGFAPLARIRGAVGWAPRTATSAMWHWSGQCTAGMIRPVRSSPTAASRSPTGRPLCLEAWGVRPLLFIMKLIEGQVTTAALRGAITTGWNFAFCTTIIAATRAPPPWRADPPGTRFTSAGARLGPRLAHWTFHRPIPRWRHRRGPR